MAKGRRDQAPFSGLLGLIRHMAEVERGWFRRSAVFHDRGRLFIDAMNNLPRSRKWGTRRGRGVMTLAG